MNLFEIKENILNCIKVDENIIDQTTGEILDEEYLENLQMEFDTQVENIAKWCKNLESDIVALRTQEISFAERRKRAENRLENLKGYLAKVLNGRKWDYASDKSVAISFKKSEVLVVNEINEIPNKYYKEQEPKLDKATLKKDIKNGAVIMGVGIEERENIQVK